MKREPKRIINYRFAYQLRNDEVPWVRIKDLDEMDLPRPVGLINGAFDILHSGHMKVIFAAKDKAATLICALDGDEKIKNAKGPGRPIMTFIERATALGFMPVDYIVEINNDEDMIDLIAATDPNFRVQGVDYRSVPTRFPWIRKYFVRGEGMRTSTIVDRIVKNARREG